jgi:cytosine/creatinine deaminase
MASLPANIVLRNATLPLALLANRTSIAGQLVGDCLRSDLVIQHGRVTGICPAESPGIPSIDLQQRLVLPRLTEVHCHLDKCHTINRIGAAGGNLHAMIAAQEQDKVHWDAPDLTQRAERGLQELYQSGCGTIRTHIDWVSLQHTPTAWHILSELAQTWADRMHIQHSALLHIEAFADLDRIQPIVAQIAATKHANLGAFVFNQINKRQLLANMLRMASTYQLAIDLHVDEGLSSGLDGLETIAELISETGFNLPVLCGHACSLNLLNTSDLERVLTKVARAGITIVSLPTTNLYLQDRQNGTPQQRGLTRLHELASAGVPITIGCDNVADAFCPLGAHDPVNMLHIAALVGHLDPPYGQWLPLITTNARRALGLDPVYLEQATINDLLICEAHTTTELVRGSPRWRMEAWLEREGSDGHNQALSAIP